MDDRYDYFVNEGQNFLAGIRSSSQSDTSPTTFLFKNLRILHITSGKAEWVIADTPYTVEEGDLIIFNNIAARRISKIYNSPLEYHLYAFPASVLCGDQRFLNLFYHENRPNIIRKSSPYIDECYDVMIKIYKEIQSDGTMKCEIIRTLLWLLLLCCIRAAQIDISGDLNFEKCKSVLISETIADICHSIQNHPDADLSVSALAKTANFSKGYLSKTFKQVVGISLNEYVNLCRVDHVCRVIAEGHYNVLDAALQSGFQSSSGFYKTFMRIKGMPPRRYFSQ